MVAMVISGRLPASGLEGSCFSSILRYYLKISLEWLRKIAKRISIAGLQVESSTGYL